MTVSCCARRNHFCLVELRLSRSTRSSSCWEPQTKRYGPHAARRASPGAHSKGCQLWPSLVCLVDVGRSETCGLALSLVVGFRVWLQLRSRAQPFNNLRKKFPAKSFTGQPTLSELGFDLLNRLLTYDPEQVAKRKRSSRMCHLLTYSHTACRESPQRRLWIIHGSKNTLCQRTRT
eukprot:scaffold7197_cov350-Prasinococcus_capsulatus_cf.AAC.2